MLEEAQLIFLGKNVKKNLNMITFFFSEYVFPMDSGAEKQPGTVL